MRRFTCGLAVALCAATTLATTTFFGPKTYTLAAGAPQLFTETIAVDSVAACDGKASFIADVENHGVSSGTLTWNGIELIQENDFRPNLPSISVPLRAGSNNVLSLSLKGGPQGASVTIAIRRVIEASLFPPRTYVLTAKDGQFSETFNVADPTAMYTLVVANGDDAGAHRVRSATVSINGNLVASGRDLNASVDIFREAVTVQGTNTIAMTVDGEAGDVVTVSVREMLDESACGPHVYFTTPAPGATARTAPVITTGTATGRRDVGITINGVAAEVDIEHAGTLADPYLWAAALPLVPGTVTLNAVATDANGAQGFAQRNITEAADPGAPRLYADLPDGPLPLTVSFTLIDRSNITDALYEADLDGDGTYERSSVTPPLLQQTYDTPGVRVVSVRITRADGTVQTASAIVNAMKFSTLNSQLQQLWHNFTSALSAQNLSAAEAMFDGPATIAKYHDALMRIRPKLPAYAASLLTLQAMEVDGRVAHYLLTRNEDGQTVGYHVYFVRDASGVWKLHRF